MAHQNGWIGVDLDGTLAVYGEWQGIGHIGEPVLEMVVRVKDWLSQGVEVRIFTARVDGAFTAFQVEHVAAHESTGRGRSTDTNRATAAICEWCKEHIGAVLPITNRKDFGMIVLWDDRCVQVEKNTGRPVVKA